MTTMKRPEEMPNAIPYPVSAISVSGLYRLSQDSKSPIVQRHDATRNTQARTEESGDHEYTEPQLHGSTVDLVLSGPDVREELRIDVDGQYPLMLASGTLTRRLTGRIHWIANLKASGRFSWSGTIWFKDGATQLFPFTNVTITVTRSLHNHQRRATVLFSGGGAPNRTRGFRYASAYFREVGFEFDFVAGVAPVTQIDTTAHPNYPSSITAETLSIETVFRRAGFKPHDSRGAGLIEGAGENSTWSDMEMHDAMQTYWSRYAERAQWSLWTLFASRHDMGPSLGGIMFDDIGPQQRQGAAIFYDSFISQAPAGDSRPQAWVDRMRFWTAVHEMGHTFNLAHSWQKSLSSGSNGPWIPLADEPEARSFMNYPYGVTGGQTAFFSDFEYRFSDNELTFMRHAPASYVEQGNAPWFDEHGFEQANVAAERTLRLELRVNRARPTFEFLEPVVLELKLTNISEQPQILPDDLISNSAGMTVIVKKDGQPARSFLPFTHYCRKPGQTVLRTGQSIYDSLFVAADRNGWNLAEPGHYEVQVCLHIGKEDVVSNPLELRIAPASERTEEVIAQDFFSKDVGRVLAFDGSRFFDSANDTLRLVGEKLEKRRVSVHAKVATLLPALCPVKRLEFRDNAAQPEIVRAPSALREAGEELADALAQGDAHRAAETLGHVDYNYYLTRFAQAIEAQGGAAAVGPNAIDALVLGEQTLLKRGARKEALAPLDEKISRIDHGASYKAPSGTRAA